MSDIFETMVRPYTTDERKAMAFEPGVTPAEKAARLISSHTVEIDRYKEAVETHPFDRNHFYRQIMATNAYFEGMLGSMITDGLIDPDDYPAIMVRAVASNDGTEKRVQVALIDPALQNSAALEMRHNMPA